MRPCAHSGKHSRRRMCECPFFIQPLRLFCYFRVAFLASVLSRSGLGWRVLISRLASVLPRARVSLGASQARAGATEMQPHRERSWRLNVCLRSHKERPAERESTYARLIGPVGVRLLGLRTLWPTAGACVCVHVLHSEHSEWRCRCVGALAERHRVTMPSAHYSCQASHYFAFFSCLFFSSSLGFLYISTASDAAEHFGRSRVRPSLQLISVSIRSPPKRLYDSLLYRLTLINVASASASW